MKTRRLSAYNFFMSNAGYSYDPKTQTPMEGRAECAKSLAYNEQRARDAGVTFAWEYDQDITSAEWISDHEDGGRNNDPWRTWSCLARTADGKVFASLSGIDFGRDGEPFGDPYMRVVEAELACELPMGD